MVEMVESATRERGRAVAVDTGPTHARWMARRAA
jgi:hypothetical protein